MLKYLNKDCIRIFSCVLASLLMVLSVSFLVLSFESSENQVLRLLDEGTDMHFEKRVQYTFIMISFTIMITASLGLSAAYSQ